MAHHTALGQRMLAVNQEDGKLPSPVLSSRIAPVLGLDLSFDTIRMRDPVAPAPGPTPDDLFDRDSREVSIASVVDERIKYSVKLGADGGADDTRRAIQAALEARPLSVPPLAGQRWTPKGGWTGPGFDQPLPEARPSARMSGVSVGFVPGGISIGGEVPARKDLPGPLSPRLRDEPPSVSVARALHAASLTGASGAELDRLARQVGFATRSPSTRPSITHMFTPPDVPATSEVRFALATEDERRQVRWYSCNPLMLDDGRVVIDTPDGAVVAHHAPGISANALCSVAGPIARRLQALTDPRPNTGSPGHICNWIQDALAGRGIDPRPFGIGLETKRQAVMTVVVRGWVSAKDGEAIADVLARARREVVPPGVYLDVRYPDMDTADRLAARLRDALASTCFGPPNVDVKPNGREFIVHADVFVPPVRREAFENCVGIACKDFGLERARLSLTTATIPHKTDDRTEIVCVLWDFPDEAVLIRGYHVVGTKAGLRADVMLTSGRRLSFIAGDTSSRDGICIGRELAEVRIIEDTIGPMPEPPRALSEAAWWKWLRRISEERYGSPEVGAAARLAVRVLMLEPKRHPRPNVALLPEQARARRQQNIVNGRAFIDASVESCNGDARDLLLEFGQKKGARWERLRAEVANLVEAASARPEPVCVTFSMLRDLAYLVAQEDAAPSGPRVPPHQQILGEATCDARAA